MRNDDVTAVLVRYGQPYPWNTDAPSHIAIPLTALTPDAIPAAVCARVADDIAEAFGDGALADFCAGCDCTPSQLVADIVSAALRAWPRTDDTETNDE